MEQPNNATKRNRIVRLDYVFLSDVTVIDYPGNFIQVITDSWVPVPFSNMDFMETDSISGGFVDQDMMITRSGYDDSLEQEIKSMIGNELLLKLTYQDGTSKIVGTEQNPVILGWSSSGSPVKQTLSCKRKSAERAKNPLS